MAPGASRASSTMLRARRRDANIKPNRRLDKKSSRGMLYENEELRMRTITINEEVEKGQNDIKKLRRENEQLRKEIWGLRDEYDRLEEIVEDLKDETDTEDESECDDEDDDEQQDENPENLENAEKEQQASNAHASSAQSTSAQQQQVLNRGNSIKMEFDGLSIVDEETDDNQTPSNDVSVETLGRFNTGLPSPSRIGWKYGNPANQQGPPGWKFGNNTINQFQFPSPNKQPQSSAETQQNHQHTQSEQHHQRIQPETNLQGRFFARMPSQIDEPQPDLPTEPCNYGAAYQTGADNAFCGTIILPNGREGVYYSDATSPDGDCIQDGGYTDSQGWEDNAWGGGDPMLPKGQCIRVLPDKSATKGRIGYAYSYYGNRGSQLPEYMNGKSINSIYDIATPPESDNEVFLDCYDQRCGPDLVTSNIYPVAKSPAFSGDGNVTSEVNCNVAGLVDGCPDRTAAAAAASNQEKNLAQHQTPVLGSRLTAATLSVASRPHAGEPHHTPQHAAAPSWTDYERVVNVNNPSDYEISQYKRENSISRLPYIEFPENSLESVPDLKNLSIIHLDTSIETEAPPVNFPNSSENPFSISNYDINSSGLIHDRGNSTNDSGEDHNELLPLVEFPEPDSRVPNNNSVTVLGPDDHKVDLRKYSAILNRQHSVTSSNEVQPYYHSDTSSGGGGGGVSIRNRQQSIISTTISTTVHRDEQRVDTLTSIYEQECSSYRQPPPFIRLNSIRPHTLVFASAFPDLTVQEVIDALDAQIATDLSAAVCGVRVVNRHCYICLARQDNVAALLASGLSLRGRDLDLHDASCGSRVVALSGVPHHVTDSAVAVIMSNFGTIIGEVERRLYKGVDTGERLLRIKPGAHASQQMPPTLSVAGAQVTITLLPQHEVDRLGGVGARDNTVYDDTSHDYSAPTGRDHEPADHHHVTAASLDNSIDRFKTQLHVRLKTPEERFNEHKLSAADHRTHYPRSQTLPNNKSPPQTDNLVYPSSPIPNSGNYVPNHIGNNPFSHHHTLPNHVSLPQYPHPPCPQNVHGSNPFSPQYNPTANEHINPTFNTYSPKNSPVLGPKFSGTNMQFVETPNMATSPVIPRRNVAVHSDHEVQKTFSPNSSYLHGNVNGLPQASTSQFNTSSQNIQQNQTNTAKSNLADSQLDVPVLVNSAPNSPMSQRRQRPGKKHSGVTRQRSSDELVQNQLSVGGTTRQQTAPNSPSVPRKSHRVSRKMSYQSNTSNNVDNDTDRSMPNATSSPLVKHKGNRKLSVSINEGQHQGTNIVDVSRSSSSGQDSPTKVERRRRVSIYFNNKKSSRRGSAALQGNGLLRSVSLDPLRGRYGNSLDGGNNEQTTTCSERERTNSVSSRGSSIGGGKRKQRRASLRTLEGADEGKLPWCGCWGNGCI